MRIVTQLSNQVSVFQPNQRQLATLAERLPKHEIVNVTSDAELLDRLPGAEALVVWAFREEWYALSPKLRAVFTPSAGREQIASDPRGRIPIVYGSFHGEIMAESLLSMILFMNRRLGAALEAQSSHAWDRSLFETCQPLAGQTALIVGYGAIGRQAAKLLRSVGLRVFGVKRDRARGTQGVERIFAQDQALEAISISDHIVCILPGDTGTDSWLGETAFERMKATAFLYNLGRGNAIDTGALARALRTRKIAGAFLDVVPEEPLHPESSLWTLPNLFLTPHASAIRVDYLDRYFDELIARLTEQYDIHPHKL
jgi:phosphoglycerate dehydrogenase-like enzyme